MDGDDYCMGEGPVDAGVNVKSGLYVVAESNHSDLAKGLASDMHVLLLSATDTDTVSQCIYERYQACKAFSSATVVFLSTGAQPPNQKNLNRRRKTANTNKGQFEDIVTKFATVSGLARNELYKAPGPLLSGDITGRPAKTYLRIHPQDVVLVVLDYSSVFTRNTPAKTMNNIMYTLQSVIHTGRNPQLLIVGAPSCSNIEPKTIMRTLVSKVIQGASDITPSLDPLYLPRQHHIERSLELLGNRALDREYFVNFMEALKGTSQEMQVERLVTNNTMYSLILALADPTAQLVPSHPHVLVLACNSDLHLILHTL
ncbi:hypothetical protein KIPB_009461, partial [Kipferlia bialata]|eukprot:g9461.t1